MSKRSRKKSAVKRTRRSPYERSLEYATTRLEKALVEFADYQSRLEALNKEIPYLQTVIRALTPQDEQSDMERKTRPVPVKTDDQAAFLSRFVKPVNTGTAGQVLDINVSGKEDPFLPDDIPGNEILS